MKGLQRTLALSLAALVMLSATSLALADNGQSSQSQHGKDVPVSVQSDSGKLIVHNSQITIWFQGYKPVLHIFERNASGNTTGFTVGINGVYEINSTNAPVAVLPMNRAFPEMGDNNGPLNYSSGVSVQYNNTTGMMNITFSLTANELKVMPLGMNQSGAKSSDIVQWSGNSIGQASVEVVFHINANTAHVKFDFIVNHWTWANSTSDRLALSAAVIGHQTVKDNQGQSPSDQGTQVGNDNGNGNTKDNTVTATPQNNMAKANEDNVSIVGQNFLKLGYVSWGSEANATYANGTTTAVGVSLLMFKHGMTEDDYNYNSLLFVFNTPAGWNTNYTSLVYDPTIGLSASGGSGISEFVTAGAVAGALAAVAAIGAALVIRRRK